VKDRLKDSLELFKFCEQVNKIMGLCITFQAHGLKKTVSRQAMHDIKSARKKDMIACAPVFETLKFSKKMQNSILDLYEHCCSGGRGSIKYLFDAVKVDKAHHHFVMRSFTYFNPGGKSFTCPQFCVLVWNLLTLQMNADAAAEWSFKVWFGGATYSSDVEAEKKNVFEMLDSSLGLSSKYDYRPNSEKYRGMKGFVGNSHQWDVKKGQLLMKSCVGDGDVHLRGWLKLAARAKPVCKFPYSVCEELRMLLKNNKQWQKMTIGRKTCQELDEVVAQIKILDPECLKSSTRISSDDGKSNEKNKAFKKKPFTLKKKDLQSTNVNTTRKKRSPNTKYAVSGGGKK
jgi:hypothetical protein